MIKPTGPLIINLDSLILSKNESEILSDQAIGGVILFNHNYSNTSQVKSLISSIKDIRDNIIIAIDHEGGRVQRFKDGFTLLPSFSEISQLYNQDNAVAQEVAYSSGYVAGYELKTIGVDINFSPVVDLTSKSIVMSERTLSTSPEVVISLASSYIRGLIDNGILPTFKHFPGHGAVTSDTHTDISKCNLKLHELSSHISTFKDLHEKYKLPIMTSHIVFNQISNNPVTTSSKWLCDLSEKIYEHKPFYISDDLEMAAITQTFNSKSRMDILNKALQSGCNMTIVTTMQNQDIIKKKSSYNFYSSEYLEKSSEIIKLFNQAPDLPCLEDINYNIGSNEIYQKSIKCIKKRLI